MNPEQTPHQPERSLSDLGLDPENPNDRLIIEGSHGDYTMALWMLAKEDLMARSRTDEFTAREGGPEHFRRLLGDVNTHIVNREIELGYREQP